MSYQSSQIERDLLTEQFGVSRETCTKLQIYVDLLVKWQASINLVSPTTVSEVWTRHIIDSVQLVSLIRDDESRILDVGSGGGFPALPIAICRGERAKVTMVEAVAKKTAFLRAVSTAVEVQTSVKNLRLEKMPPHQADLITARAFAPLNRLLGWSAPHLRNGGRMLLLKGGEYSDEISLAQSDGWRFTYETTPSVTDASGVILSIQEISHDADHG